MGDRARVEDQNSPNYSVISKEAVHCDVTQRIGEALRDRKKRLQRRLLLTSQLRKCNCHENCSRHVNVTKPTFHSLHF